MYFHNFTNHATWTWTNGDKVVKMSAVIHLFVKSKVMVISLQKMVEETWLSQQCEGKPPSSDHKTGCH